MERQLTKVVDKREETSAEEQTEEHGREHIAILEHARRKSSLVTLPELDPNEDCNHEAKANKEADNL